jgi:phosphatidate cytidylyltransferase
LKPLSLFGGILIAVVAIAGLIYPLVGGIGAMGLVTAAAIASLIAGGEAALWRAGGLMFFGLVIVAALAIRGTGVEGIWACLFLGVAVWMTDTGAFFAGRQIGGERLAPDISPGKTWSGAIGGFGLAVVAGTAVWIAIGGSPWWMGTVLAAALSILGQLGDLTESAIKRRFRVKDSGDIIPGHGGLMDRLDSITFALVFLLVVGLVHGGFGDVAAGILHW